MKMEDASAKLANWPVLGLLFVLALLSVGVFQLRNATLDAKHVVPDARWQGYSPQYVVNYMEDLGADGCDVYAATQLTLDVAFPLIYGALFLGLFARCLGDVWARYLWLAPAGAVVLDLTENVLLAYLAWSFNGDPSLLAWLSAGCTVLKWLCVGVSTVAILIGGCVQWLRWIGVIQPPTHAE